MPFGGMLTVGTLAGVGALAGGMADKSKQSYGMNLGRASPEEERARAQMMAMFGQLGGMVGAGPGMQDVTAATGAGRDLASMLQQMQQNGGLPSDEDVTAGGSLATKLFGGQREQMRQAFADQLTSANQQAALSGRSLNDPILRNKLAQEQTRQSSLLSANEGSLATQLSMNLPGQRLGFAQQRAGVLGGLATQAMANRQALAAMGSSIQDSERNFRMNTATKYGNTTSGGGLKGLLEGGVAGAGMGMGLAGMFGGGGGGGGSYPSAGGSGFNFQGSNTGSFFGQANPYFMNGLSAQPQQQPFFSGGYQMGSQWGQPRQFSLNGQ
jgi:hypothetical protein